MTISNDDLQRIAMFVDEMASEHKTDFILEIYQHVLTEDQQAYVLMCLEYNTPFEGDCRQ